MTPEPTPSQELDTRELARQLHSWYLEVTKLPDPSVGGKARQLKDPNSFKNNPEKAKEASRIGHAKNKLAE